MGLYPIRKQRTRVVPTNPRRFAWLTSNITSITLLENVTGDRTVCAENDKIRSRLHQLALLVSLWRFILRPRRLRRGANC